MARNSLISQSAYAKLLKDIRQIIADSQQRAAQAVNQELVRMYWSLGQRIDREGIDTDKMYSVLLHDMAEELDMDYTTLTRCVHFYRMYPKKIPDKDISWAQYKLLIPIKDEAKREWYIDQTIENNLSCNDLSSAIRNDRYGQQAKSGKKKKASAITLNRPVEATYVYKAVVDDVVDGDTLVVMVDLGFTVWKEQRLRLAEIDCPALDEPGGEEATQYVRDQLSQVDFIMIKTNKIDIYGRYVAHVFYAPGEKDRDKVFFKGRYLNQEILDKGMAIRF